MVVKQVGPSENQSVSARQVNKHGIVVDNPYPIVAYGRDYLRFLNDKVFDSGERMAVPFTFFHPLLGMDTQTMMKSGDNILKYMRAQKDVFGSNNVTLPMALDMDSCWVRTSKDYPMGADVDPLSLESSYKLEGYDAPKQVNHPIKTVDDLKKAEVMGIPDFDDTPLHVMLDGLRKAGKQFRRDTVVLAPFCGPYSLAAKMTGVEDFLVASMTEPEFAKKVVDFAVKGSAKYVTALLQAGSELNILPLMCEPVAGSNTISPQMFREQAVQPMTEVILEARQAYKINPSRKAIRDAKESAPSFKKSRERRRALSKVGAGTTRKPPVGIHICGDNVSDRMFGHDGLAQTGADFLSIEASDLVDVADKLPNITFMGNISTNTLRSASEVEAEVKAFGEKSKGVRNIIVAPGCQIGSNMSLENMQALLNTARTLESK